MYSMPRTSGSGWLPRNPNTTTPCPRANYSIR